jgi:hypothetical protein
MLNNLSKSLAILALSGITLLSAQTSQAQLQIQSGNINGSLTFDRTSLPPSLYYRLISVSVNSFRLNLLGGGSIENFEGGATLTGANIQNPGEFGLATIGTSGNLSGVVTGRSLLNNGQFLVFNNTPINLQAVVTSGTTDGIGGLTVVQTGTLNVLGGSIQSNASLTPSTAGNAFISSNAPNVTEVANSSEFQEKFAKNSEFVQVGSSGVTQIKGPASRIFPMQ